MLELRLDRNRLHRPVWRAGLLVLVVPLLGACYSDLLREQDVRSLNQRLEGRVFVVAEDIRPTFADVENTDDEVLFHQGDRIRLFVQSEDDWIKVRGYPADAERENEPGGILIYVLRDVLIEEGASEDTLERYPVDRLEARILELVREQ